MHPHHAISAKIAHLRAVVNEPLILHRMSGADLSRAIREAGATWDEPMPHMMEAAMRNDDEAKRQYAAFSSRRNVSDTLDPVQFRFQDDPSQYTAANRDLAKVVMGMANPPVGAMGWACHVLSHAPDVGDLLYVPSHVATATPIRTYQGAADERDDNRGERMLGLVGAVCGGIVLVCMAALVGAWIGRVW